MDGAEVQQHSDTIVYRASSLGSCTKRLVALRLGYEPLPVPEDMKLRFAEGHLHEQPVLETMEREGWRIYDQQAEVKVQVSKTLAVVGHIDAKGYKMDKGHLIEVKSQSDEEYKRFASAGWEGGLFPKYKWQVSVYMLATGFTLCLVRKNRNTGQVSVSYLDEPPYSLAEIRSRVLEIESWARRGELPDECTKDYPCPVAYLHPKEDRPQLEDPAIDVLAQQYEDAKTAEKLAKERKDTSKKALDEALGDNEKVTTKSGIQVTFYWAKNPARFSEDKMKADGIDVDKYKVQGESRRVRVTLPKEDDGQG